MTIDTQQEALDALADAALGTDSPSEAFIQGYLAGRTAVITDEEIEAMAQHMPKAGIAEWNQLDEYSQKILMNDAFYLLLEASKVVTCS